jgi:predicted transcriptional regulator
MRRRGVTPEFFRDAEKDYNSLVRRRDAIRNRLRVSNQSFVRMRDLSKRVADKKSEMYNDMKARIAAFRHLADLIKLQNDGLATMFLDLSENMSDIDNTIESDMMILMTQGMKKSDAKSMLKDIIQTRLQVKFPKKTKAEIEKAIEKYQELIDKMSGDTIDLNFIKVKNQLSSISGIVVFNQNANKYEMILDVPGVLYFDQTDPAQKKTGEELLKLTNVAGQPIFLETGENTDPNSGVTIKRIEAINSPRVDVSADLLYHVKAIPNDNATVPSSKFKWNSARNGSVFNAITTNNRTNQVINNLQRQLQIARRRLRVYNKKKTMLQRAKTAIQPNTLQGILDRAFASVGITLTPEDIENIITQGIKPDGTINQSYIRRLFRIGSAKAKRVADIVFADMPNLTVYPDVEKSLLLEELKKQYDAMPTDLENQEAYETVRDEVEATDD